MTARNRSRTPRRGPGRPPSGVAPPLRERLLEAARSLFTAKGFADVSLREVASEAGVSPAMIAYYFGGKEGLYEAVLESALERLLLRLRAVSADAASGAGADDAIATFLGSYLDMLVAEPWIPQLIVREVIAQDSPLRARFRRDFAGPAFAALGALLAGERARGRLRSDLDDGLTVLSLIGMAVFPFLAHPVIGEVIGYRLDEGLRDRLFEHTRRLFLEGARPREGAG